MDQTHIGYTYWQEPPRNVMPRVDVIQVPVPAEMGVAYEGQVPLGVPGQGPPPAGTQRPREPALPEFDAFQRQTHYIDVYNRGQTPLEFEAKTGEPWVVVTPSRGRVEKEQRLQVTIDWDRVPNGVHRTPITLSGPGSGPTLGPRVIQAIVRNPIAPKPEEVKGFVEGNGYVSMEAEHYTRAVAAPPRRWQRIPTLGRTLSGMTAFPVPAGSVVPRGTSARLEYQVFMVDSGAVQVKAYLSPTLDFRGSKDGLRYAISFDDEPPQIINTAADSSNAAWEKSVAESIKVFATRHTLTRPGAHVLKFWLVDPGVVLQKLVIDAGGERPSYLGPPESYRR
jgi:hypothetical protein